MGSLEVLEYDFGTHTDPKILAIVEIPGCGVTSNFSISRFFQHGEIEESIGYGFQTHRCVELIPSLEHLFRSVTLTDHLWGWIRRWFFRKRSSDFVQIDPESTPHVAQKMGWKRPSFINLIWVNFGQSASNVSMQFLVQWLHLYNPSTVNLISQR